VLVSMYYKYSPGLNWSWMQVLVSMLASMGEKVNLIKEVPCDGHIVDWAKDLEASVQPILTRIHIRIHPYS